MIAKKVNFCRKKSFFADKRKKDLRGFDCKMKSFFVIYIMAYETGKAGRREPERE